MPDHPITPPSELVRQWLLEYYGGDLGEMGPDEMYLARCGAQWGADQELEACCKWLVKQGWFSADEHEAIEELRFARRPKPPSLKVQALLQLDVLSADLSMHGKGCDLSQIRRALEQLND